MSTTWPAIDADDLAAKLNNAGLTRDEETFLASACKAAAKPLPVTRGASTPEVESGRIATLEALSTKVGATQL